MAIKVYGVFDEKAKGFLQPFFLDNDALAKRAVALSIFDPQHNFCVYTADYTLFCLGGFDVNTGQLTADKKVVSSFVEIKAEYQGNITIPDGGFSKLEEVSE